MKKCPMCGDEIYAESDEPLCYRCKGSGARVRLEIYDKNPDSGKEDTFASAFLGGSNFKDLQRKNIRRGGFT
jgi:hypothetical protein